MHSFLLFSLCARRVDSFSRALVTPGAKYSLTTAVTVNFAAPNACINLERVRSDRYQCKLAFLREPLSNAKVRYRVWCKVSHRCRKLKNYLPLLSSELVPCKDDGY